MNEYSIPQHLDEPMRIILWTIDEFIVFSLPFIVGIYFLNAPILSLIASAISLVSLKKLKGSQGCYFLYHLMYWYLPPIIHLRATPPSFKRVFLG